MKKTYDFLIGFLVVGLFLASCKKNSSPEPEKTKSETLIENITIELEKNPEVASFSEAFKSVKLSEEEVKDGLTILAPINEALRNYRPNSVSRLKNSIKLMADINSEKMTEERLKDHIIKGVLSRTDFNDGDILISLSGKKLRVTVDGGKVSVNGVEITSLSSSASQMIYSIPEVLTNTDPKIYLPVKFTYTKDALETYESVIKYVENTQLMASVEEPIFKQEYFYNEDKLQKVIRYQRDMPGSEWRKQLEEIYEFNKNGDVSRINTKVVSGLNLRNSSYRLYTYNAQKLASIQHYQYRGPDFIDEERMVTNSYEYDVLGNVTKEVQFWENRDVFSVRYEYDNKNGIYKYVKNQWLSLFKNNNVIKNFVDDVPSPILFTNNYLEYNAAGLPTKYIETNTTSGARTVTVEYIER